MPNRILAASDVHIGGLHLNYRYARQAIAHGIANCDEAVLVGDIFEAKSKTLSEALRLKLCREAIDQWATVNPKARVHIILGNHERPIYTDTDAESFAYCHEFMAKLMDHAKQYPNVIFHNTPHLQIGDALFIHGHHEIEYPRSRLRDGAESIAGNVITTVAHWIKPRKHYIDAINNYIQKKGLPSVHHVFFGHIHQAFLHYRPEILNSPEFHNLGTFYSLFRQDANPVMVTQDDNGHTLSIERFCKP